MRIRILPEAERDLEIGCDFVPYGLEAFLARDTQKFPFWADNLTNSPWMSRQHWW